MTVSRQWGGQQKVNGREREQNPLLRKRKARQGGRAGMKSSRWRGTGRVGLRTGQLFAYTDVTRGDGDDWPVLSARFYLYQARCFCGCALLFPTI